jgi:2-polyprenyl-6-hydroxyphenyl methylase/3-demethylubiquinone-9 3-methyltransferase
VARDLTRLESHFAFGENWSDFAARLGEAQIARAVESLARLLPPEELAGRSFLDIGSGSGLSSLAALRLGAGRVLALDIDPDSVATTSRVLAAHAPGADWTARAANILDVSPAELGRFDVVHSWGVLHHTGDMWRAVERAAALVAPGGLLALALYRKTPACGAWREAKRLYSAAPAWAQAPARWLFSGALLAGVAVRGADPVRYVREYREQRGMSFRHDVHDWLGGYPYESAAPDEVLARAERLGLTNRRSFLIAQSRGLFGSGCDEFVFGRPS